VSATSRKSGQAQVEFAFAMPVFFLFIFSVIQLSLVFIFFYSETSVARGTARWLAVHGNSLDSSVAAQVQQSLLPGMIGGTPTLISAGTTNADTQYQVGNMRVWFTPCLPSGTPTVCTHPRRAPGSTLHVQMSYDMSNLFFLPTNFQLGWMSVAVPTALPSYTVYVMTE
jgi:hypothetical protein